MREIILSSGYQIKQTPNSGGWHVCKCPLCNDYKVRAGFKFEDEGFGYNCFNCATGITYNPHEYPVFNEQVLNLMERIGISSFTCREIEQHYQRDQLVNGKRASSKPIIVRSPLTVEPLILPEYFIPLSTATSVWADVARAYLENVRKVDITSHCYMILDYDYPNVPVAEIQKWHKRIIIPFLYNGEVVWWQGRDYSGTLSPKYLNSVDCGTNVLFSRLDKFTDDSDIVFVLEGFFDALQIDGVACFRNKLTDSQLNYLTSQQKRVVYIPDRLGQGHIAAIQCINAGLYVGLPDIGNCKDIDEAVKMYGKFYVYMSIIHNMYQGDEAMCRLNMYCNKDKK